MDVTYSDRLVSRPAHSHMNYELIYVLKGGVALRIRGREYRASAGAMVFLNPMEEHGTRLLSDVYERYALLVSPAEFRELQSDPSCLSVFRFHGSDFPYVIDAGDRKPRFDLYFALLKETADGESRFRDERLAALMTLILTDARAISPEAFAPAENLSFLPMRAILDELDETLDRPFSLSALAKKHHVSASCLSAHFTRAVGISPMGYVTQSRLSRAKGLLAHTNLPVSRVAAACGYPDTGNFIKRFRRAFDVTPARYRKRGLPAPT